ncbi:helix-turn-helix domain-containing protein [Nonomuraea jiangxiensis]|uniref:AraC-type DNA-binding protein n=1 Tax=Nonomuraea jiangxiensis TaxID=633440 RepID=A0A1G8PYQ2_9ACTN|nr:helix-turn-helix domain-containing protein [Nonomuraea jiangxiensis]SDI97601.1 AraC-type DNA-binding protein [Nonomuraea jiangxiensis]
MPHHFHTDQVAAGDRFDYWWSAVAQSVVPVRGYSEHAAAFWAEMRSIDLGDVRISRIRSAPFQARRTPELIAASDPGLYQLSLTLSGSSGLRQGHREAALGPADMAVYDTSQPFWAWSGSDTWTGPGPGTSDGIILQFDRKALPVPAPMVERLLATRLSGRTGVGGVLALVLRRLARQEPSPADGARLSGLVLDLVTDLITHELDESTRVRGERTAALFLRVQAFVEQHLDRADLTPSLIAAGHHISTRYLHRLFQRQGLTVRGWIQQRRLERCRHDLADPGLDGRPVSQIAARWGWTDSSHFNRAFRAAYGMPPAAYRRDLRRPE